MYSLPLVAGVIANFVLALKYLDLKHNKAKEKLGTLIFFEKTFSK